MHVTARDAIIQDSSHVARSEAIASAIKEERFGWRVRCEYFLAAFFKPERDRVESALVQWHQPFFSAFPQYAHESLSIIHAVEVEITEFRNSKSGAVEHFADGAVQERPLVITPLFVQERFELFAHHHGWQHR